jgi:hypothetical protein
MLGRVKERARMRARKEILPRGSRERRAWRRMVIELARMVIELALVIGTKQN